MGPSTHEVIEDQQIEFVELGDGGLELQFAAGNLQFLDQIRGSGEHDPPAVFDQRQADGGGEMALSAARRTEHEDICALGQPAVACGHGHELCFRDHGNSVEIEAVHRLAGRQVRFGEMTGDPAVSAFSKFVLCDGGQETRGRTAFLVRLLGDLGTEGLDGGQPQVVHDSLKNVTPADVYFGRHKAILREREKIKKLTIRQRRLQHQKLAA